MSSLEILFLAAAGFAAGAINALAGGGTLFTFSALMFTGLPPVTANTTSAVAVLPGQIAAGLAYLKDIRHYWREWIPLTLLSGIGGLVGGLLLLNGGNDTFRFLVPYLVLLATILFLFSNKIAALGEALARRTQNKTLPYGVQGLVGIYGGYFGAGMGIMMLASLPLTEGGEYHRVNAAKSLMATVMQGVAVILFLWVGDIDWAAAGIVAAASITGGYLSIRIGRHLPSHWLRRFVITVGFSLSAWYFVT
jgi:uncharacterized protein